MFGIFKKDPIKKLETQYQKLLKESFELSKVNRKLADEKVAKAEEVSKEIERLKKDK
jgi:hypothetical protein